MHNSAAWCLTGAINAIQLCAGCNGGHAVMLDEVLVRFIALPMEFDGMLDTAPFTHKKRLNSDEMLPQTSVPAAIKCGRALGWL